jgi:hypothetical protein
MKLMMFIAMLPLSFIHSLHILYNFHLRETLAIFSLNIGDVGKPSSLFFILSLGAEATRTIG